MYDTLWEYVIKHCDAMLKYTWFVYKGNKIKSGWVSAIYLHLSKLLIEVCLRMLTHCEKSSYPWEILRHSGSILPIFIKRNACIPPSTTGLKHAYGVFTDILIISVKAVASANFQYLISQTKGILIASITGDVG